MAMEAIALTSLIVGTLPRIITAIENFRHDINASKSKQAFKTLRKDLTYLCNLQHEVEKTTRRLGAEVPRKLYQIIRALGLYCRRLGERIHKNELLYKKKRRIRIMVLIGRSTGLFDPIKQYINQVEDCEDWYNIALKTLYLRVSQVMPQVARETQYKEELRQHLRRFSRRAQSGRYRKMEHANTYLCPKTLKAHAEIVLDDPTTIATSSTASTPKPRCPPSQSTQYSQYYQKPLIKTRGRPRTNPIIAQEYMDRQSEHYRPSKPPAQASIYGQRPQRAPIATQDDRNNHQQYCDQPFPSVQAHIPVYLPQTAPRSHPAMPNRRLEPNPTYEDSVPGPRPFQQPDFVTSHRPSPPPRHHRDVDPRIYHQSRSRSRSTSQSFSVIQEPHRHQRSDVHKQNCPPVSYSSEREMQPLPIHYPDNDQKQRQSSTRGRSSSINRDFSVVQEQPRHQTSEVGARVNLLTSNNSHRRHNSSHSYARSRSSSMSRDSGYVEKSSRLPKSRAGERRYPPASLETRRGGLGRHREKPSSRPSSVSRDSGYGSIGGQGSNVRGSSMDESARSRRSSSQSSARSYHSQDSDKPPRGRRSGYEEESSRHPRERPSEDDRQPSVDHLQHRRLRRSKRRGK